MQFGRKGRRGGVLQREIIASDRFAYFGADAEVEETELEFLRAGFDER